jgi:hypothetical protein
VGCQGDDGSWVLLTTDFSTGLPSERQFCSHPTHIPSYCNPILYRDICFTTHPTGKQRSGEIDRETASFVVSGQFVDALELVGG